jgi:hypothetical protein
MNLNKEEIGLVLSALNSFSNYSESVGRQDLVSKVDLLIDKFLKELPRDE